MTLFLQRVVFEGQKCLGRQTGDNDATHLFFAAVESYAARRACACTGNGALDAAFNDGRRGRAEDRLDVGHDSGADGSRPDNCGTRRHRSGHWQNIFEGLVTIDHDGKVKPQLAESWEISADGKTYTFKLRQGVTFHDGEVFDSSVAKFSLDRARGETSVNPQKRFFTAIESIETPNAATLILKLKQPAGSLIYWLGWPASVMVAPKSADNNRTTPIGTGPFKFVNWAKGDKVELEKNAAYWDKAVAVKLEKATFRFVSDPQAQAAALKSGDIDAFPEFGAPELMTSFDGDARLGTFVGNTELKVVAGMNNARKPFNDKRVRQALMMAVDRGTVIEGAWSGYGTAIGSHYTPNDRGYIDTTGVHSYDIDKAKALLAESGYPRRFQLHDQGPANGLCPADLANPAGDVGRNRCHHDHRDHGISGQMGGGCFEGRGLRHDHRRPR